jgi:(2Fe-2S) ferredoxin
MDSFLSPKKVMVCVKQRFADTNQSCGARGSEHIVKLLELEIARENLPISVERSICFGMCDMGPNVRLAPGGKFFHAVTPLRIPEIVESIRQFIEADSQPRID